MNPATGILPSLYGDQLAPAVMCQRKVQSLSHQKFTDRYEVIYGYKHMFIGNVGRHDTRMHLYSLVKFGYMNKDVASSMKESADGV
eukprot:8918844-Ditylum_brightwellii.AAC.1